MVELKALIEEFASYFYGGKYMHGILLKRTGNVGSSLTMMGKFEKKFKDILKKLLEG